MRRTGWRIARPLNCGVMRTEADWFKAIEEQTRTTDPQQWTTLDGLRLVEQALAEHPQSSRLWNRRGDLIQLLHEDLASYSLTDARVSYQRALAANPNDPEAYESLGYFFDAVDEQLDEAERMFRRAIQLGAGVGSWVGLARVLAEMGRRDEALTLLAADTCPHASVREVIDVRGEIKDGRWDADQGAG
jgi:tetratricopeptide (TPR) repeat protein